VRLDKLPDARLDRGILQSQKEPFPENQRSSTSPHEQELTMSGINGDKSRFHRERKQKIARRSRNRGLWKRLAEERKPAAPASGSKPKEVSA